MDKEYNIELQEKRYNMDDKVILQNNILKLQNENKKLKKDLAEVNEMYNRASLLIIQKNKAIVRLEKKYNDLIDELKYVINSKEQAEE